MELYFVRHGETDYNKNHQLMGQKLDAPLDETGVGQAHMIISKLPKDFALIYSSPLQRATQTARVIADYFNKNIEVKPELKERDFGSLSGKTWDEIDEATGLDLSERDKDLDYDYTKFGGESVQQVKDRLNRFLAEAKSKHPNETLVVVTHYGIISLMEKMHEKKEHHDLTNASVHKFEL